MTVEPEHIEFTFSDESYTTLLVTRLGEDRYRIVGLQIFIVSSFCDLEEPIEYGDTIEAERDSEGKLIVRRVSEKGSFRTFDYLMPEGWYERSSMQRLLQRVEHLGGVWECIAKGILIICVPSEQNYDPTDEMRAAMK